MANSLNTLLYTVLQTEEARKQRAAQEQMQGAQAIQAATQDVEADKDRKKAEAQQVGGASQMAGETAPQYENPEMDEAAGRGALYSKAAQAGTRAKGTLEEHLLQMKNDAEMQQAQEHSRGALAVAKEHENWPRGGSGRSPRDYLVEQTIQAAKVTQMALEAVDRRIKAAADGVPELERLGPSGKQRVAAAIAPYLMEREKHARRLTAFQNQLNMLTNMPDLDLGDPEPQPSPSAPGQGIPYMLQRPDAGVDPYEAVKQNYVKGLR
jgi:hypothetical protein